MGEEEVCHTDERGGELGHDPHQQKPETAAVASLAIRAASEGNDTVVLGEGAHGRDGGQAVSGVVSVTSPIVVETR